MSARADLERLDWLQRKAWHNLRLVKPGSPKATELVRLINLASKRYDQLYGERMAA